MADKDYALQLHRTLFPALFDEPPTDTVHDDKEARAVTSGCPEPTKTEPLDSPSRL